MQLKDGESVKVKGSAAKPYVVKNVGGVLSCDCAAWRNFGGPINARMCKHVRKTVGEEAAEAYLGKKLEQLKEAPPTKAPGLILAHSWNGEQDPKGWLLSEKLDGVRAYWDGTNFISRLGNIYHAPEWFKKGLPINMTLDGELWVDRKQFQKTVSIVRKFEGGNEWEDVLYMVFDCPSYDDTFEYRFIKAKEALKTGKAQYAQMLDHVLCKNIAHLKKELTRIESLGGEGLMIRDPNSKYEFGRSHSLLKVKSFLDDEAKVIGYEDGKGKHKGRMGGLLVKIKSGVEFILGTGFSDAQREDPPKIGATVTFKYQELSKDGVPRFGTFLGERVDA